MVKGVFLLKSYLDTLVCFSGPMDFAGKKAELRLRLPNGSSMKRDTMNVSNILSRRACEWMEK